MQRKVGMAFGTLGRVDIRGWTNASDHQSHNEGQNQGKDFAKAFYEGIEAVQNQVTFHQKSITNGYLNIPFLGLPCSLI